MTQNAPHQPLRLHRFVLSGHCHRVELLLSLLELSFQAIDVDLAAGEQKRPRFLALNPLGQVPVLEDGPLVLADSNAILVYLSRSYGGGRFQLESPALEAEQQRWFSIAAGPLAAGPAAARIHHLFGRPLDINAVRSAAHGLLRTMDAHLAGRDFLLGARLSLADIACYTYTAHAPEGGVLLDGYPAMRAWLARIEALPRFVAMPASPRPVA
jgi:glutathione S-transferase